MKYPEAEDSQKNKYAYKCLKGGCQEDGAKLFPVVPSDRTRSNGHKLKQRKLQLNMRKNFFPLRVTEPWPRLPREAVESPSLEIFQPRLDVVLCSLLWVTLLGQGVGLGDPQRSLPPRPCCDSMKLVEVVGDGRCWLMRRQKSSVEGEVRVVPGAVQTAGEKQSPPQEPAADLLSWLCPLREGVVLKRWPGRTLMETRVPED